MLNLLASLRQKAEVMPSKRKIDRAKVMASPDTICTQCGHAIPPGDLRQIYTFLIECPKCGDRFDASERKPRQWRTAILEDAANSLTACVISYPQSMGLPPSLRSNWCEVLQWLDQF